MSATEKPETLSADEALRLAEFARACKAATRIVALYPSTHPAIRAGLQRVADTAQRLRGETTAKLTVTPDDISVGGKAASKPDGAIGELASLLHSHLVGEMSMLGEMPSTSWHTFLSLLARTPEDVRAEGGIARAWMTAGGGPIELRQIDYTEVLRERSGAGLAAEWDRLIANYLEGDLATLDESSLAELFQIASDDTQFKDFTEQLVSRSSEGGKKEIVLKVLQALADYVARTQPDQLDRSLRQIAGVLPKLTPDLVVTLITTGVPLADGAERPGIDLPGEVRARISDRTVSEFVANSVERDQGATGRLAQAFQALVPEADQRKLLEMAQKELSQMPIGQQPEFPDLWKSAENLLMTYSDSSFVSDEYARELSIARTHAIEVERVSDDPPERISAWLASVSEAELRKLDQRLLLDLLEIETREDAWRKVVDTTLIYIDHLVLEGNIALAQELLDAIVAAAADEQPFTNAAREGLERLRKGPMMKHVVMYVRQAQESQMKAVSTFCRTAGPGVIGSLAEALASEEGNATVRRLREILLSFGAAGRAYADELRNSANPSVRRTAIELLRAFGGADALPDLAALLEDKEPGVQREALRAIVQIGTDEAYGALQEALKSGNARTRDVIMQVLGSSRDERAAPLFVYILEHTDYRGGLERVYLSAIEALGKVGGEADSVAALRKVLYRREWWAPFRTGRMRTAAALALRASGSDIAKNTLEEAASAAPRAVRRIARAAMAAEPPRAAARRAT
jgi:HEAT repeat protein